MWKPEGKRPLGRPGRRWEDNIKLNLQEVGWEAWTGLIWLRIGTGGGHFKRGNEPLVYIKCGEFVDWLRAGYLLRKDCAPWSKLLKILGFVLRISPDASLTAAL